MYSVRLPNGIFLDLFPNQQFAFELVSTAFSSADLGTLPGNFSFPSDLPATPFNKKTLGFPNNVHVVNSQRKISDVWVFANGVPFFFGDLTVRFALNDRITVNLGANIFTNIKDVPLADLDLGGSRAISGGAGNWAAQMLGVASNPDAHDYNFIPVRIQTDTPDPLSWVNRYDLGVGFNLNSKAIVPMVKVQYLLKQIFAGSAYHFENGWQVTKELTRLVQYDHQDVRVADTVSTNPPVLPPTFDLTNHVPKLDAGEYLKRIASMFNLGFFANIWSKTLRLLPLSTILQREAQHNWTAFAVKGHSVEFPQGLPGLFGFKNWRIIDSVEAENVKENYKKYIDKAVHFNTMLDWVAASSTFGSGWIYIEDIMFFGLVQSGVILDGGGKINKWVRTGTEKTEYLVDSDQFGFIGNGADGQVPITDIEPAFWQNSGAGTDYKKSDAESPFGLFLYRGMAIQNAAATSDPSPRAYHHVWNPYQSGGVRSLITGGGAPTETSQISLNWTGDYGLYKTFHQPWHDILRYGKQITIPLTLPISELIKFGFDEKIRISGMEYLAQSLRVNRLLPDGYFQVEARLVSVI